MIANIKTLIQINKIINNTLSSYLWLIDLENKRYNMSRIYPI